MAGFTRLMRVVILAASAVAVLGFLSGGEPLSAQTLEDLEADFQLSRGMSESVQESVRGGEPVLNLFTIVILAVLLLLVGGIFIAVRVAERWRTEPASTERDGGRDSYFMNIAFLAAGYVAIIFMLAYLPMSMTPGLGNMTRLVLLIAAVVISVAHLLAARDERALPPNFKYLFSGGIILAACFFHLSFKKWSFLQFSDPFYRGKGPYIALGFILLLAVVYSAHNAWQHFRRRED